jgi:hypothetical protein
MTNAGDTFLAESGWTSLGTNINNDANMSAAAHWRRLVAGDTNPTFDITANTALSTSNGLYGRIFVFRDCITTGNPFEGVGNAGTPTSSTTPSSSAITTTGPNRFGVVILGIDDDPAFSSGFPPSGWTVGVSGYSSTTGGDARIEMMDKEIPTATTESAVTIGTLPGADFWRSLSFALIPAAAPAGEVYIPPARVINDLPRRFTNQWF